MYYFLACYITASTAILMISFSMKTRCLHPEIFSEINYETMLLYSSSFSKNVWEAIAGAFFVEREIKVQFYSMLQLLL